MRFGLFASIAFHVVIICVLFVSFSRPHKADLPPQVAIEVMTPVEYSERLAGRKSAKADKPATPAEVKAPEKEQSAPKEGPEKPAPKPAEQAALPPPPKRSEAEADANSRPASPQPRREQRAKVAEAKPAPEKTAEAKPAAPEMPVQRPRQTTEKAAKPKPVPAGDFDAGRIAALLRSKADQEDRSPARSEARDAAPSTT
jgi:outer membrane biosynthesis protein TonB